VPALSTRAQIVLVAERLFADRGLPLTAFAVARALQAAPPVVDALLDGGHEIAGHGLRWISYQDVDVDT